MSDALPGAARAGSPRAGVGRVSPRLAVEIFLWRHGRLWALAIVFATLASAYAAAVRPLAAALRNERAALAGALDEPLDAKQTPIGPAGPLDALHAVLPGTGNANEELRRIYAGAQRHGLTFSRSSLHTTDSARTGTSRVELTLPLRGRYPQVADFLEALLRDSPNVSVDQLRFRRDTVSVTDGEAEVRISCWLRTGGAANHAAGTVATSDDSSPSATPR